MTTKEKIRILILDDDFTIREILKSLLLRTLKNVLITTSDNGVKGLALVEIKDPDLIVVDSTLPEFAGSELVTILKQKSSFSNARIIALLHEDEDIPEINNPSVVVFNKKDPQFLEKFNNYLIYTFSVKNLPTYGHRVQNKLAKKMFRISNRCDVIMHKISKRKSLLNPLRWMVWLINQIFLSFLLTFFYLISGGKIKEGQESDAKLLMDYRVRYYPSLTTLIIGFILFLSQLSIFVVSGLAAVSYNFNQLMAQSVCSLPSAPTVINSQIIVSPDNIDGIIDCGGLDIIVGPTGEIVMERFVNSDGSTGGDWGVTLLVNNLTVQSGGKITADGKGYTVMENESGGGKGGTAMGNTGGSGGGHGGAGGLGIEDGVNSSPTAGTTYGNNEDPFTLGSAGGNSGTGGLGGNGGGLLKLIVSQALVINGEISADGQDGLVHEDSSGGGGSGGSIWIQANTFSGSGQVSANGGGAGNATYQGGGGGGGRIRMFCISENHFNGTATATQGITSNSQDGGVGTILGPTCRPNNPVTLKQFKANNTTEILVGGATTETTITLAVNMDDPDSTDTLMAQFELRPLESEFTNQPTHTQVSYVTNPQLCDNNTVNCGKFTITGLSRLTDYHWQVRIRDNRGGFSDWVSFGSNTESEKDFYVTGLASKLVYIEGNSQSGVVGSVLTNPLSVKVTDSNDVPIPAYTVTWSVLNGLNGGTFSTGGSSITNNDGISTRYYKLGNTVGTNIVRATGSGLTGAPMDFSFSSAPDELSYFSITSSSVNIVNQDFSSVTIRAYDQFNNIKTDYTGTINISAVEPLDTTTNVPGNLTPTTSTFTVEEAGEKVINNMQFDTADSIKIKVQDGIASGFSISVAVVVSIGSCPDVDGLIDTAQTWSADGNNLGIFDCRGVDVVVTNSATLTLNSAGAYNITLLSDNLTVDTGAAISSDQSGYILGPGGNNYCNGCTSRGASFGGAGSSGKAAYGDVYEPNVIGSGRQWHAGASRGGGAIKLDINGAVTLNGTIRSNGTSYTTGGSIWINTGTFDGSSTGRIYANGGSESSGGRIAIYHTDGNYFTNLETNNVQMLDAVQARSWAPGTIYIEQNGIDPVKGGRLYVDNGGTNAGYAGLTENNYKFELITLKRYGHLNVIGVNSLLEINSENGIQGDTTKPSLQVNGVLSLPHNFNIDKVTIDVTGDIQMNDIQNGDTTGNLVVGNGVDPAGLILRAYTSKRASLYAPNHDIYYFDNLTVKDNGVVTVTSYQGNSGITADNNTSGYNNGNDYGTTINVIENFVVETSGLVSADQQGYILGRGGNNYCNGCTSRGASHGGIGSSGRAAYGNVYEPLSIGSGRQWHAGSARGGGAMKIEAPGVFTLNGTVRSNGTSYTTGGSIWIEANVLNGASTGRIYANGGSESTGGRIAVHHVNGDYFENLSTGGIAMLDAIQSRGWAAGTIYIEQDGVDSAGAARLYIDNGGTNAGYAGLEEGEYEFSLITMNRYGHLNVAGINSNLIISTEDGVQGDSSRPTLQTTGLLSLPQTFLMDRINFDINGDLQMGVPNTNGNLTIGNGTDPAAVTLRAHTTKRQGLYAPSHDVYTFDNLTVRNSGTITLVPYDGNAGQTTDNNIEGLDDYGVTLRVISDFDIQSGGVVTADQQGYITGPGGNSYCNGCTSYGASHGGIGTSGRSAYGDVFEPKTFGSGRQWHAGATRGGGAYKIEVDGVITLSGIIRASGASLTTGGSIWLDVNTMNGSSSGNIYANGGTDGASGGRIAIYYTNGNYFDNLTVGNIALHDAIQARGWAPGTVYIEQKGVDIAGASRLYIDNANVNGGYASLIESEYQFTQITQSRYGHLNFDGENSQLTIPDEDAILGDTTRPTLQTEGLLKLPGEFTIDKLNFDINGNLEMNDTINNDSTGNITIGNGSDNAGLILRAYTSRRVAEMFPNQNIHTFDNITINNAGSLTLVPHDGNASLATDNNAENLDDYGVTINVTGNFDIKNGGVVSANQQGFIIGPGGNNYCNGCTSRGASHGGIGSSGKAAYGDVYEPVTLGSGRQWHAGTSRGGGAFKLNVENTFTLDGTLTNNGTAYTTGGSIWINANTFNGTSTGRIYSNGGTESTGGRIAIYYNSGDFFNNLLLPITDVIQARGWAPGTIYIEQKEINSHKGANLYIDNAGTNAGFASLIEGEYQFQLITQKRYGHLNIDGANSKLTISDENGIEGDTTKPSLQLEGILSLPGTFTIDRVNIDINGDLEMIDPDDESSKGSLTVGNGTDPAGLTLRAYTTKRQSIHYPNQDIYNFNNLAVRNQGVITLVNYDGNAGLTTDNNLAGLDDYGVTIHTTENFDVESGGIVSADQQGYSVGPGGGNYCNGCSHASSSHGGFGTAGRAPYGDLYKPVTFGSGKVWHAGTHRGGGAFKLDVEGVLTLDGNLQANGIGDTTGGSIWVDANTLNGSGTGRLYSNGGYIGWPDYRGGSGGRIAVYYNDGNFFSNLNTSIVDAIQTRSNGPAGPGTIYIENRATHNQNQGDLIIEDGGTGGRAQDFNATDYTFNDVYIGTNVTQYINTDKEALRPSATLPEPEHVVGDSIAAWHFEESEDGTCAGGLDACDSSSSGYHLENYGTQISEVGRRGKGRTFDGDQYLELNVGDSIDLTNITINAWVKGFSFGDDGSSGNEIVTFDNNATTASLDAYTHGENVSSAEIRWEWPAGITYSGYTINANRWYLVTTTYESSTGISKVYINGELVLEKANTPGAQLNTSRISIGKGGLSSGDYWKGMIDEVSIYDRVFDAQDAKALYHGLTKDKLNNVVGRGPVFKLTGDFTLAAGAYLDGKGRGFGPGEGPGAGAAGLNQSGGAGAGHGGTGGDAENDGTLSNSPRGGSAYSTQRYPYSIGSGGGAAGPGALGGEGGGSIAIEAPGGVINIAGTIDVRGNNGRTSSPGGGGGAGGSIFLLAESCSVSGSILASGGNGGDDIYDGGGGGGGRISILYTQGPCEVTGTTTVAQGSTGVGTAQAGQVGTYPTITNIPDTPEYKDQFHTDGDTVIPVGGAINESEVILKVSAFDNSASDMEPKDLQVQIEVVPASHDFNSPASGSVLGLNISSARTFTGGEPEILEIPIAGLIPGEEYKWQARVLNIETGVASEWDQFGDNGRYEQDFSVSTTVDLSITPSDENIAVGSPISLTVEAIDNNGNTDPSYTGTVTITSDSDTAVLPSNYSFTESDNGTHTFDNVIFTEPGEYTITVTDTNTPSLNGTTSTIIVSSTATSIRVENDKNQVLIGEPITLTVEALNGEDEIDPTYRGTVSFDTDLESAVLPDDYTFTINDSGSREFTNGVIFDEPGIYTVTVTDTNDSSFTSTTEEITVYAPTDDLIVIPSSTSVSVGDKIDLTVKVYNEDGEIDTFYQGTIEFSSDQDIDLPEDYTFTLDDAGEVVFEDAVTFLEPGTYTITVTDPETGFEHTIEIIVTDPNAGNSQTDEQDGSCAEDVNQAHCQINVDIIDVTVDPDINSVELCWDTNIHVIGYVNYGIINSDGTAIYTDSTGLTSTYSTSDCIRISDLEEETSYVYEVVVIARSGKTDSTSGSFVTDGGILIEAEGNACISGVSYSFNSNSKVIIDYKTYKEASCRVVYGHGEDLIYSSSETSLQTLHSNVLDLSNANGNDNLMYRIICDIPEDTEISQCSTNGVIPVAKYLPYYPNQGVGLVVGENAIPILLTIATIATGVINVFSYPGMMLYAIPWFASRKRKSTWGVIYDAQTKEPIPFVAVRMYDAMGRVQKQLVTGFDGKYGFLVNKGNYVLEIKHTEYNTEKIDIVIDEDEGIAAENIGLVKTAGSRQSFKNHLKKIKDKLKRNLSKINNYVVVIGFMISVIAVIANATILNYFVFSIYCIQFLILILLNRRTKEWGYVYESENHSRIKSASVRVFDIKQGRQVDVQLTDSEGRFGFKLLDGDYRIQVNASGYELDLNRFKGTTFNSPTGQNLINISIKNGKQMNLVLPMKKNSEVIGKFGM